MQITLTNLTSSALSLDLPLRNGKAVRGVLAASGGTMDVSPYASLADLEANVTLRAMMAAGELSMSATTDSTDAALQMDDQLIQGTQQTAANLSDTLLGTAELAGFLVVEAQVGAIPATGESMAIVLKKNGTQVGSTLTINATNSPTARKQLTMALAGATVAKGDELSWALTYTAGGTPTPIVRTCVRVKVLKAL